MLDSTANILHSKYSQEFYRLGILHRSNGLPAIVFKDGILEYYEH